MDWKNIFSPSNIFSNDKTAPTPSNIPITSDGTAPSTIPITSDGTVALRGTINLSDSESSAIDRARAEAERINLRAKPIPADPGKFFTLGTSTGNHYPLTVEEARQYQAMESEEQKENFIKDKVERAEDEKVYQCLKRYLKREATSRQLDRIDQLIKDVVGGVEDDE